MIGTAVSTLNGSPLQVQSIEYSNQAKTVYNFSVENTHSYFVGTSGVWVHNADVPCLLNSLLRVVNEPQFAAPDVIKNDIKTVEELALAKKVSSYNGGRRYVGERNTSEGTMRGYDGWWGAEQTGRKVSLKAANVDSVRAVLREAGRAENLAVQHGFIGSNIDLYSA